VNQTSPMNTATAAGAAAVLMPIVAYAAQLLRLNPPEAVLSSIVVLLVAGGHWLGQYLGQRLPVKATAAAPAPITQGGFAIPWQLAVIFASVFALAQFAGCASGPNATPSQAQVQQIENASAIDAGLRPSVTALLAIPGLATPQEVAAVIAARAVIDPICANPSGNLQANAIATVTSASATIVGIAATWKARGASAVTATPVPAGK
jgi:hypothetical protein